MMAADNSIEYKKMLYVGGYHVYIHAWNAVVGYHIIYVPAKIVRAFNFHDFNFGGLYSPLNIQLHKNFCIYVMNVFFKTKEKVCTNV